MARRKHRHKEPEVPVEEQNFWQGYWAENILDPVVTEVAVHYQTRTPFPMKGWAFVTEEGEIWGNRNRLAKPEEWTYALAHCALHLAMGHFVRRENQAAWDLACDIVIHRFLATVGIGTPPVHLRDRDAGPNALLPGKTEEKLYQHFVESGIPPKLEPFSLTGGPESDMVFSETASTDKERRKWQDLFAAGLADSVADIIDEVGGVTDGNKRLSHAQRAKRWFVANYPLLGALASSFDLIEDSRVCQRLDISVAAVSHYAREIYINPAAGLDEEENRFVMAHELLHVALQHQHRRHGRDAYLWNVACDYAINDWLIEMQVGVMPAGLLHDPELRGLSAESIYDRIVRDLRRCRKLSTLRGRGKTDMLDDDPSFRCKNCDIVDLETFYRNCLRSGLNLHELQGRGLIPAGLVEEIRALDHPPIPWDVELARWFDLHIDPLDKHRAYARPSRRQGSTPDIPRPRYAQPEEDIRNRTFGAELARVDVSAPRRARAVFRVGVRTGSRDPKRRARLTRRARRHSRRRHAARLSG